MRITKTLLLSKEDPISAASEKSQVMTAVERSTWFLTCESLGTGYGVLFKIHMIPGDKAISEETEHDVSETNLFFSFLSSRNMKQLSTT